MEQRELLDKLNGRVTFTYVLEKEMYALRDYLESEFKLRQEKNKKSSWNSKPILDKHGKTITSPVVQQEVKVGGKVVSVFDFSEIRVLEPGLAREAYEGQSPIIDDVYLTIDDGLGSLNLCIAKEIYEEMKEQGEVLGSAYIFQGYATVVERSHVDPIQMKVIENQYCPRHISIMAYHCEKLD